MRNYCTLRTVPERGGAKHRSSSPPLRHPHTACRTVLLPVSALQAAAESSVGVLYGWRCAVTARFLLALAVRARSFGRWQRSRVQAKSECTINTQCALVGYCRTRRSSLKSPLRELELSRRPDARVLPQYRECPAH